MRESRPALFPVRAIHALALAVACVLLHAGCGSPQSARMNVVPKWEPLELVFTSSIEYTNALQQAALFVSFTGPTGQSRTVEGFWDGGATWRVRFAPNEAGAWHYATTSTDAKNSGLNGQKGRFLVTAPTLKNRFTRHGPIKVSRDGHYLEHEDGTPFFWLADTAWNGPLMSSKNDWNFYIRQRLKQNFTAVQWVATQWRAAPEGDLKNRPAFTGHEAIAVNPEFFRHLDGKAEALYQAGMLNVPVLLWAIGSGSNPKINPGFSLPDDQAALLARYMVARWQAYPVVWMLGGDGNYQGEKAEKWKRIGREVFGEGKHAPATMHPGGMQWVTEEFRAEPWYKIAGYQSGHGDSDSALRWIFAGPPATEWKKQPALPFINLEPPYEGHLAYQSRQPITAHMVRRASYWSLLIAPTAGVSYGGHGVWGWDDGTKPPVDHPNSGVPLAWTKALVMPAAQQMAHLADFFTAIPFWKLRPAPEILAVQPGDNEPRRQIAAARTQDGNVIVVYVPEDREVVLRRSELTTPFSARWVDPRIGKTSPAQLAQTEQTFLFTTPGEGDWLLYIKKSVSSR